MSKLIQTLVIIFALTSCSSTTKTVETPMPSSFDFLGLKLFSSLYETHGSGEQVIEIFKRANASDMYLDARCAIGNQNSHEREIARDVWSNIQSRAKKAIFKNNIDRDLASGRLTQNTIPHYIWRSALEKIKASDSSLKQFKITVPKTLVCYAKNKYNRGEYALKSLFKELGLILPSQYSTESLTLILGYDSGRVLSYELEVDTSKYKEADRWKWEISQLLSANHEVDQLRKDYPGQDYKNYRFSNHKDYTCRIDRNGVKCGLSVPYMQVAEDPNYGREYDRYKVALYKALSSS